MSRGTSALVLALAALLGERTARAGAFEVEGVGPAGVAEVNARAARAEDGSAAFYNPGGLGLGRGVHVEAAPMLGVSALSVQGQTKALVAPFGIALTFDATIPFEGFLKDRIRVAFASYVLPTAALRLVAHRADEPFFPYYDNRTQRLVLLPALAVRIVDGLALGVAFNVLGGVTGSARVAPGASGTPESRLDLRATTSLAINAGVRFDPTKRVHLAFAVRQGFAAPAVVNTTAELAGIPLKIDVATRSALFDPTTIVAAASFGVGPHAFELDASYAVWSAYQGPFVHVTATLPGVNVAADLPAAIARDVVSLRAADAMTLPVGQASDLVVRVGLGFEPSMLKGGVQGRTNLVDGDKFLAGFGATLVLREVLPFPLRIGFGGSTAQVSDSVQTKRVCSAAPCAADTVAGPDATHPSNGIKNPGYPTLSAGGAFWSTSLGLGVDL